MRRPASPTVEQLEPRQFLSAYYVSSSGNDGRSGTSSSQAWRSIDRVNKQVLKPGDKVLFQGGQTFSGSIYLPSKETGTSTKHLIFSTYGSGRAAIRSGSKPGIDVAQGAGIEIMNLNFFGGGLKSNKTPGIYVHIDFHDKKTSGLVIRNVKVTQYGKEGIFIKSDGNGSSLSDVKVEKAYLHDNLLGGLRSSADRPNSNKNWLIQEVWAYNNPGDGSRNKVTGNGIHLDGLENAIVQRCVAFNNGKNGAAPVGIWASHSKKVTFQYNESYNNRTVTGTDGGGFDFDWEVHDSVMQYNYSHGNDGPGYLLCPADKSGNNNVIRYNISENDGRKNGRAGLQLFGNVTNATLHNNTVYLSGSSGSGQSAFWAHADGSKVARNVVVRNNIFYTAGGAKVLRIDGTTASRGSIKLHGNAYYAGGSAFKIEWGSKSFSSLSSFRGSTGQEKMNGQSTGYEGNPKLTRAGGGGTVNNPFSLGSSLSEYRLSSTSPLVNRGIAPTSFLSSVVKDFFGGQLPKGGKHDIGAHEVR